MIITLIFIGISLAMDTFSVSLSLGSIGITKNRISSYILLVGIFHFLFPIIGYLLGNKINIFLNINGNILLGLILLFIAVEMIIELTKKEDKSINLNIVNILLLAISVSLDSLFSGIGLPIISNNYVVSSLLFSTLAIFFSYIGYILGNIAKIELGKYANIVGIIILIVISTYHLFVA